MSIIDKNLATVSPSVSDIFNANSNEMVNVVNSDPISVDVSYTTTSDSSVVMSDQGCSEGVQAWAATLVFRSVASWTATGTPHLAITHLQVVII